MNLKELKYLRGNIKAFGLWGGIRGTMRLVSPWLNMFLHNIHEKKWKVSNSEKGS